MTSKLATLQDACTTRNTTIWAYGTGCSQSGNQMHVAAGNTSGSPNYDSNVSNSAYDLTGSYIFCKVTVSTGGTGAYTNLTLRSTPSGNGTDLTMAVTGGNLTCNNRTNYYDSGATSVTYNATSMAWWQIVEHNGTISFQTSPDGQTWTTQRAIPTVSYATSVTVAPSANNTSGTSTDSLWSNFSVNASNPKVSTLADPFLSFDSALWTQQDPSQVSYANAVKIFPATSGFPNIKTVRAYDLTSSSIFAKLVPPTGGSVTTTEMVLTSSTPGTDLRWTYNATAGTIIASSNVSYNDAGAVTLTYSATQHVFFKISESAGTMTWWTSPDGINWTSRRTLSTVSYANSVSVVFSAESTASSSTVAVDAASTATHSNTSPITWSHTGTAGAAVIVGVCIDQATSSFTCAVTYAGTSMTLLGSKAANNGNNGYLYVFGLANIPGGSQTVSVSWTGTTDVTEAGAISLKNVPTSSVFGSFQSTAGYTTNPSLGFTTTNSNSQVVGWMVSGETALGTPHVTGATEQVYAPDSSTGNCGTLSGATAAGTSGTVTFTWTAANDTYAIAGAEVLPSISSSGTAAAWSNLNNAPVNTVTIQNPGPQVFTSFLLQIVASDSAAGQTLTYTATGLPVGVSINPQSGVITGNPSTPGTYTVTVTATDTTGASASTTFTLVVNSSPPPPVNTVTVTNPGPQSVAVGTAVALHITATDSAATQTLTFAATGLPAGLSIASGTGMITGTPTAAGTFSATVTATDTTGAMGSTTFTWTVGPAPVNVVTVVNPGNQSTTVSVAVALQVTATDSAAGQTLTYTASGLPAGLSIASTTGKITGTPTSTGTSTTTVTATDTTNAAGSTSFTWTINSSGPVNTITVTNPGAQSAVAGTSVSLAIAATDSASGQTLTYTAVGLPTGLSINSSTGVITGTPTVTGTFANVTVTVKDTTNASGSVSFTWTVTAPNTVTVTNPGPETSLTGIAVSLQIAASDSASGQTLTFTAAGLPPGLSISSTGLITGTPTTTGNYSPVVVTVTDTTGAAGSVSFGWTINNPPPPPQNTITVTNPGLHTSVVDLPASLQIVATDTGQTYTLSYLANNLPAGLTINASSGLITGTPTTTGTYNPVTVVVSDQTGASGQTQFSWVINTPSTRDPLQWPFATGSIWNMPIGTGAVYVNVGMSGLGFGPNNSGNFNPMPFIDDERIILQPTAPATTVGYSSVGWSGGNRCVVTNGGVGGGLPITVPIPSAYTVANSGQNNCAAILEADGRTIAQCQPFTRCAAGGEATSVILEANVDLYSTGITGSHGGSGLSAIGGSIRLGELRPGQTGMRHALKIGVDETRVLGPNTTFANCFRWPAITADAGAVGDYGSNNSGQYLGMKMGALMAIPASVNLNTLGLSSATGPGMQLAWTLQNYGCYIVDSQGLNSYSLCAETGAQTVNGFSSVKDQFQADWGFALQGRINDNTPWTNDFQKCMEALQLVDNNSPTTIGGGGTPLQPLAPPISPTSAGTLPPPSGTNVTVDFRSVANGGSTPVAVDALGVGITISGYSGGGQANIIKSSAWLQLLKNLAPGSCRIPMAWFNGNPGAAPGGAAQPGTAIAYITAVNSMGAVPYVIYAGDSSDNGGLTGTNGGNFVNYFNSTSGGGHAVGPVKYWVVGNEPDNGGGSSAYLSALPGVISGMHGADSTTVISAPAAAYWDTSLISSAAAVTGVGILSYHAYDAGDAAPPGGDGFPQTSQYYNNIITMKGYKSGILYGCEEFNWNFASAGPQNWQNTVWMADVIGQNLAAGGHAIMYADSNGQLGLINDGSGGGNQLGSFLTPQPAYWAVGIWTGMNGQFLRYSSNMVSASSTISGNTLGVYACDNGKIILVNKSTSAQTVTIGMGGKLSGTYSVWGTQMGNPSGAIQQLVAEASYNNQVINYTVPAGTAVSVNVA